MTEVAAPKQYTKADIKAFTLTELEKFAKDLSWKRTRDWGTRIEQYRTAGFPKFYDNTTFTNRADFLRRRLMRSSQEKWNPALKAVVEAQKAAKKAAEARQKKIEALQPKITVELVHEVKMRDRRANGHAFLVHTKGERLCFFQEQLNNHNKVGRTICTQELRIQEATFDEFMQALELDTTKLAARLSKNNPHFQLDITMKLKGDGGTTVAVRTDGEGIVYITQAGYERDNLNDWWHFNISDLKIIAAVVKQVKDFKGPNIEALEEARRISAEKIAEFDAKEAAKSAVKVTVKS